MKRTLQKLRRAYIKHAPVALILIAAFVLLGIILAIVHWNDIAALALEVYDGDKAIVLKVVAVLIAATFVCFGVFGKSEESGT